MNFDTGIAQNYNKMDEKYSLRKKKQKTSKKGLPM
jgi:hypothetical protein